MPNLNDVNKKRIAESTLAKLLYDLSDHVIGCEDTEMYPFVQEVLSVWAEANMKQGNDIKE